MKRSNDGYYDDDSRYNKRSRHGDDHYGGSSGGGDNESRKIRDPILIANRLRKLITRAGDDGSMIHYKLITDAIGKPTFLYL